MQDDYIDYIIEKYNGSLIEDSYKKVHTYQGKVEYGKLSSKVVMGKHEVFFNTNQSEDLPAYSASIVVRGGIPVNFILYPKNWFRRFLSKRKRGLLKYYAVNVDADVLLALESNHNLIHLLERNLSYIAISKREDYRLIEIVPNYSILSMKDFEILEKTATELVNSLESPTLH